VASSTRLTVGIVPQLTGASPDRLPGSHWEIFGGKTA
jgi:hypothetical protein